MFASRSTRVCCLLLTISFSCSQPAPLVQYSGNPVQDIQSAIGAGDVAKVRELVAQDAALLQLTDPTGRTLLHHAVLADKPAVVKALVELGMDPNVKDSAGITPLGALEESYIRAEETRKTIAELGGVS